ncbi:MAG TPA: putative toxin-antitoxin system toxin component, PIN family [Labilithrix sp.]|nr:putative toxin-antitoxin system toxin component, PIN family [Labilithrix sp.]
MRLVVDTNVLVSALLKPGSVPDRALGAIWARGATVLYDARIADEYRRVLGRPKFRAIERERIEELLEAIVTRGRIPEEVPHWTGPMTDDDDRIFVEVALAGGAEAIVTGNARHYPTDLGFEVLPPAKLLERLSA